VQSPLGALNGAIWMCSPPPTPVCVSWAEFSSMPLMLESTTFYHVAHMPQDRPELELGVASANPANHDLQGPPVMVTRFIMSQVFTGMDTSAGADSYGLFAENRSYQSPTVAESVQRCVLLARTRCSSAA
jgi:hypothetical protein